MTLRSPTSGFIISRTATKGEWIAPSTELYKIADLSRVWVFADLFENEVQVVKPGMQATISLPHQNITFEGVVSDVPPLFDAQTRTMRVRIDTNNSRLILWPDMFVDVEFPVNVAPTLVIPQDAVLDSGMHSRVFVQRTEGVFEPREVQTGWRYKNKIQITDGLHEGEQVVISGSFLIDSESRIRASTAGAKATSVVDPVCGMQVNPDTAGERKSSYKGKTYYFCSDICKRSFDADPEKFVGSMLDSSGKHR